MTVTLVFRGDGRLAAGSEAPPAGAGFVLVGSAASLLRSAGPLLRRLGPRGTLDALGKVATPSRSLFLVLADGRVVTHGWLTIGRSPLYEVAAHDVVVGPVRTIASARGQGYASYGLTCAVRAMAERGHRTFFVHAAESNGASRRWLARSGLVEPFAVLRDADRVS